MEPVPPADEPSAELAVAGAGGGAQARRLVAGKRAELQELRGEMGALADSLRQLAAAHQSDMQALVTSLSAAMLSAAPAPPAGPAGASAPAAELAAELADTPPPAVRELLEATGGSDRELAAGRLGALLRGRGDGAVDAAHDGEPPSRRRDCHSAAPPSAFIRCFNTDKKGASSK